MTAGGAQIRSLAVSIETARLPVVQDVSLTVAEGQILGLVGESGSGKTMTGLAAARLLPEVAHVEAGTVTVDGIEILGLSERQMRPLRGSLVSMIFQDPMSSLDPACTVGEHLMEVLAAHGAQRAELRRLAVEALAEVAIPAPEHRMGHYPHQLSGGMRQRVLIAMALACQPRLLIADEPTTALDATTQAQVLDLVRSLTRQRRMATILTTHDLGVVAELCDTVAVMYAGQIVETGDVASVFRRPRHPYTERLLASTRDVLAGTIPGRVPRPQEMPPGCRFQPRCGHALPRCATQQVSLEPADAGMVRCLRADELVLEGVLP